MPRDHFLFINKTAASKSLTQSEGLERWRVFKHVQTTSSTTKAKNSKPDAGNEKQTRPGTAVSEWIPTGGDPRPGHVTETKLCEHPADIAVLRLQLFAVFMHENDRILQAQKDPSDVRSLSWLSLLPNLAGDHASLRHSMSALSFAAVGRMQQDERLIRAGTIEYVKALMETQKTLSLSDSTLAACLALIMYQFFSPQHGRQDWHAHIEGIAKIIWLRGVDDFRDELSHNLFVSARSSIISASLNRRKGTFLADEQWLNEPWRNLQKSNHERMLDCLARIPAVAESFNEIEHIDCRLLQDQQRVRLLGKLWSVNFRLTQWFKDVSTAARPKATSNATNQWRKDHRHNLDIFPHSHTFDSLGRANMFRLFCSSLADIYNMLALTYQALADTRIADVSPIPYLKRCLLCSGAYQHEASDVDSRGDGPGELRAHGNIYFCHTGACDTREDSIDPPVIAVGSGSSKEICLYLEQACRAFAINLADEVCRSFQYCVQEEHGTVGRYLSVAPLKFAIWCYTINLPRTRWQLQWTKAAVDFLSACGITFSANLFYDEAYNIGRPIDIILEVIQ